MAYTASTTSAGFRFLHWSKIASGDFIGTGSARPTAGSQTLVGWTRLRGALTLPSGASEDEIIDVGGDDDDALASFNFPSGQSVRGTMELSYSDLDFDAYVQGVTVENPAGTSWGMVPYQVRDRGIVQVGLLAQRRALKNDTNNVGNQAWEYRYILRANVTPRLNDMQSRQNSSYQASVTATKSASKPWGTTFTEATNGTTATAVLRGYSDNPLYQCVGTGDNSETAFTLPFTPVSTTENFIVAINDVVQTIGGGNDYTVSGLVVTFASAPAQDADIQIIYEVDSSVLQ